GVELRDEELVVLREGVGEVEGFLEEREATARDVEDLVGVEVLGERAAAVHAERDLPAVDRREGTRLAVVRTGDDRGDVARDARRRLEGPGQAGAALGCGLR